MFKLLSNDIRKGLVTINHGVLETPFFMPDATRAFIKMLSEKDVLMTETPAMVVNTFHLYLQPGLDLIKKAGGVHNFMNCQRPLLSDSGGFQVFSLVHKSPGFGEINDNLVKFKSPLNGSSHEISPEKSIQIQFDLGVDMMVCFDDCPPNEFSRLDLEKAVNRTIAWAKRCKVEYLKQVKERGLNDQNRPLIFGVIQGGAEIDLRKRCARELAEIGFDGYGLGARPVDKEGNFLAEVLFETARAVPEESIRFALGVGTPEDIYRSYLMGWDMFDCVIPTREGRHGRLFYFKEDFEGFSSDSKGDAPVYEAPDFYETKNINNAIWKEDFSPINKNSEIEELRTYSKAYLHHLFKLNDGLGQKLASLNNLEFFKNLMNYLKRIE